MATLKTFAPNAFDTHNNFTGIHLNIWQKFMEFADGQKANRTLWFFIVLTVHGVFILPLPAVLAYYFDAPAGILGITMVCFFVNIIVNMAGGGIRAILTCFAASLAIHFLTTIFFVL